VIWRDGGVIPILGIQNAKQTAKIVVFHDISMENGGFYGI
jgi:hypothetical protein